MRASVFALENNYFNLAVIFSIFVRYFCVEGEYRKTERESYGEFNCIYSYVT